MLPLLIMAQAPQGFIYQGVATDNNGFELQNQNISIQASILSSSATGTSVWQETHTTSTDTFGLFNLTIGEGTSTNNGSSATFQEIDWGDASHFMKVEIDVNGGTNYVHVGTSQMMSVPYALYAENTELDSATVVDMIINAISNSISNAVPTGIVQAYSITTAPTGWLLCDGSAVSRATYTDLFTLIGTTYGLGDGSTTFNLPDLRGRVPVGKDDMGGNAANIVLINGDTLGNSGGEETHTLTTDEMASLSSYIGNPTNTSSGSSISSYLNTSMISSSFNTPNQGSPQGYPFPHWQSLHTNAGDQPHNIMQPYLIMNYIIKY